MLKKTIIILLYIQLLFSTIVYGNDIKIKPTYINYEMTSVYGTETLTGYIEYSDIKITCYLSILEVCNISLSYETLFNIYNNEDYDSYNTVQNEHLFLNCLVNIDFILNDASGQQYIEALMVEHKNTDIKISKGISYTHMIIGNIPHNALNATLIDLQCFQ